MIAAYSAAPRRHRRRLDSRPYDSPSASAFSLRLDLFATVPSRRGFRSRRFRPARTSSCRARRTPDQLTLRRTLLLPPSPSAAACSAAVLRFVEKSHRVPLLPRIDPRRRDAASSLPPGPPPQHAASGARARQNVCKRDVTRAGHLDEGTALAREQASSQAAPCQLHHLVFTVGFDITINRCR